MHRKVGDSMATNMIFFALGVLGGIAIGLLFVAFHIFGVLLTTKREGETYLKLNLIDQKNVKLLAKKRVVIFLRKDVDNETFIAYSNRERHEEDEA